MAQHRRVVGTLAVVAFLALVAVAAGGKTKVNGVGNGGSGAYRVATEDYVYSCIGNCMQRRAARGSPGIVLHGGGVDIPSVYYWMVERAGGGDFLVLSATTAYDYNDPIWAASQGQLNSVATLVFLNGSAANDSWVLSTIQEASGIFFSGGDQWKYYSFWKQTPTFGAIMQHIGAAPVGGSSAGMAILGEIVNTAQWLRNVSLSSRETLANPYSPLVTLGTDFLQVPFLENVVTETHFRERNRMGRVVSFMARMSQDILSRTPRGIACDADAAVLLYPNGTASTVAWTAKDACYFFELTQRPTECQPASSLSISGVTVVRLRGNLTNAFDLSAWQPTSGAGAFTYSLSAAHGRLTSSGNNGKIY